ncbi:caspase, EACC1-associated type [Streptomyces sp. NPDC002446]
MTALPDPASSRALLIGVHDYEQLTDLPAVARNLAGLKRAFTDAALWGLPDAHCVLLSQPTSAAAVLDTLHGVALQTTDTLVVYYAGHGLTDPYSDELYLALPGSDQRRLYSALPYEWVRRAMLDPRIRARRKVVILDCCYSGRALLGGMSGTDQVADRALIEGTCLMAASAETRTALSPPGEEFTAFTGELITLLSEGIEDGPPLLDMHTLFRHLHGTLAAKGRPLPQQRNRNTGGLIALVRNRAHLPGGRDAQDHEAPPPPPDPPPAPPEPRPAPPEPRPAPAAEPPPAPAEEEPVRAPVLPPPAVAPRPVPGTGDPRPATASSPYLRRARSPRITIGVASLAVLLVAGVPAVLNWLPDEPDGTGGGTGAATYNAATKGVVNASTAAGGTLRFAGTDTDSWDPQRSYTGSAWNFARYYTRQLVTYAAKPGTKGTALTPDLATDRAKVSDGGRTYTYTLRKGVTWEDGSPLTSQDVKYGIERIWAQDVLPGGPVYLQQALDPQHAYKGPYEDESRDETGLKTIRTPDPRTIVFRLPRPNGEFEQLLAMVAASPVKREKDTRAKYGLLPFSSGPYRFRSYTPKKSLELVRNTQWKKPSDPLRTALPDKITVSFFSDANAADAALLAGQYHLALGTGGLGPPNSAKAMRTAAQKQNLDNPLTGSVRYAAFPQSVAPMDNVHCRKAVVYAADRKALQSALGGPAAGDLAPNLSPPGLQGSDAAFDPYGVRENGGKADITKAQKELKDCGRPYGFTTKIAVRNNVPAEVDAATSLQESLERAGITATVDQVDGARILDITGSPNVVKQKGYGIVIGRWGADFPTGQTFWQPLADSRALRRSGNVNVAEVDDPVVDKALDAALTHPESSGASYKRVNQQVAKAAYYLPFVYTKKVTWRSPGLTNVYTSAVYGDYDFISLGVEEKQKEK